jgi:prephenate dehydrogenase
MLPRSLAIVGVGLVGGSVGLAVRRLGGVRVTGVDRDAVVLRRAREAGVIDEACDDPGTAASVADLVLFCTPVDCVAEQVLAAAPVCRPGALLTDTGSAKAAIVRAVEGRLPPGVAFVGGHPLAGSEKHGAEHADPDLFRGRLVVLTPTDRTDGHAAARVAEFWESLGATVRQTSPEAHDRAVAYSSHLPHLAASALAGVLPPDAADLAANGFRDTTRVAAGDPALWEAILDANRAEVLAALARLDGRLADFRRALESGDRDAVRALLAAGQRARTAIDRLG